MLGIGTILSCYNSACPPFGRLSLKEIEEGVEIYAEEHKPLLTITFEDGYYCCPELGCMADEENNLNITIAIREYLGDTLLSNLLREEERKDRKLNDSSHN